MSSIIFCIICSSKIIRYCVNALEQVDKDLFKDRFSCICSSKIIRYNIKALEEVDEDLYKDTSEEEDNTNDNIYDSYQQQVRINYGHQ